MKYIKYDENFKFDVKYKIVSIFDKVINLKYDNKIYSIFNEDISEAPYTLIVDNNTLEEFKLYKDEIFIEKKEANIFSCKLEKKEMKLNKDNVYMIESILNPLLISNNIIEKEFFKRINEENYYNLIGLGLGLTPSGDDFFVGMMATYIKLENNIPKFIVDIINNSKDLTNEISYNYLINAKNALFKKEILDVVNNLDKESKILKPYIYKLLNFGSTSGRDVLLGIYKVIFHYV